MCLKQKQVLLFDDRVLFAPSFLMTATESMRDNNALLLLLSFVSNPFAKEECILKMIETILFLLDQS